MKTGVSIRFECVDVVTGSNFEAVGLFANDWGILRSLLSLELSDIGPVKRLLYHQSTKNTKSTKGFPLRTASCFAINGAFS
jgi:hypothetical protein